MKSKILKFFTKIIIMILVFGLVINYFNFTIIIKAFEKPIETILEDPSISETAEFDRYELDIEKTRNSKTYISANGLYETLIYNKAVHYLENGKYVNIDNTLEDIGNYYQNNKNAFFVSLPKTLKDNKIKLDHQDYSLKIYYDDFNADATLDDKIDRNIENLHDTIYY